MDRAQYHPLTPRDFALLVKDPDSHKGDLVVLYGQVTQFDSATGRQQFRADTGPLPPEESSGYRQNTYVTSPLEIFDNIVAGDTLRMFASVDGAYSYETTMGGHMSVPKLTVYMVDLLTKGQ
ncbi:protein PASTA domain-containing protein [Mycolicibacterium mucogenicum DSM 44124]|nr:protein PASTA domain-containing protein [Mycolicibacterium mucogenicum DSM 44124]